MKNSIVRLSEETINQIAAGEVIACPSSAVKELVENAIDAGARNVEVEIAGGGLLSITVSDDGSGMNRDDALLSLERHATSKIRSFEDLFSLTTMGFRGEALSSIAAISKLTLTTSQGGEAVKITTEGGGRIDIKPAARTRGTTLDVHSLFYNVPARKKFQKSVAQCTADVVRVMSLMSLAHPEVGFTLKQGKVLLHVYPEEQLLQRTEAQLGKNLLAVHCSESSMTLQGWVATPEQSFHNRSRQYLFINHRPVLCFPIAAAVKEGFATRLSEERFPLFLLHLTIPPALLDVNVHPQKKEVRLSNEEEVRRFITKAVSGCFEERKSAPLPSPVTWHAPALLLKASEAPTPSFLPATLQPIGLYRHYLLLDAMSLPEGFAMRGEGMLAIDLHAAMRTVNYQTLKSQPLASQTLLLPITLQLTLAEMIELRERLEEFENVGFSMHPIGERSFLIDAIPAIIEQDEVVELLTAFLHEKRELASFLATSLRKCKKSFMLHEALQLAEKVLQQPKRYCPAGKSLYHWISHDAFAR